MLAVSAAIAASAAPQRRRPRSSSFRSVLPHAPTRQTASRSPMAMSIPQAANARGGINGVKATFEECETGYTDKGVDATSG